MMVGCNSIPGIQGRKKVRAGQVEEEPGDRADETGLGGGLVLGF